MFSYTVTCIFNDSKVADEWIAWLRDEHLADVIAAGALDAEVIRMDGQPARCEVRYHFSSREAFEEYERDRAPALRAAGLQKFPTSRGLEFERSTGFVETRLPTPK